MTFVIGTPHTRNAGYAGNNLGLELKHRQEADIQTCVHCQAVIKMHEWRAIAGAWCGRCNAPICVNCGTRMLTFGCEPFLKKLEAHIERSHRFTNFLKMAGLEAPVPPQSTIYTGLTSRG